MAEPHSAALGSDGHPMPWSEDLLDIYILYYGDRTRTAASGQEWLSAAQINNDTETCCSTCTILYRTGDASSHIQSCSLIPGSVQ